MKLTLDYPVDPQVRWGWTKPAHSIMNALFTRYSFTFDKVLENIERLRPNLDQLPVQPLPNPTQPAWVNDWFSGLDAAALYSFIEQRQPKKIIEVGSGCSTKFAARAVYDLKLTTKLLSIDPAPRSEIDDLCDVIIRKPFETAPAVWQELEADDILFIDGSHRAFQNSDVTYFFFDVLPNLKPGVVVHLHDIFLPWDYPEAWSQRFYSEQYMVGAYLMGRPETKLLFSSAWTSINLKPRVEAIGGHGYQTGLKRNKIASGLYGTSLWFER